MSAAYRCDRCRQFFDGCHKGDVILRQHDHPSPPRGEIAVVKQRALCGTCFVQVSDAIDEVMVTA